MSDYLHPYSLESLCAALNATPPPPPPDGSTLRRKTQWMTGKSTAQRRAKKQQKQHKQQGQQGHQDAPKMTTFQDHSPLPPQAQPPSSVQGGSRTRLQAAQHTASLTPAPAPLVPLQPLILRTPVPKRIRRMPLPTPPPQDIFLPYELISRESTISKSPSPVPDQYPSPGSAQTKGLQLEDTLSLSGAQLPGKEPKHFDFPHTLKVKAWQKNFALKIQVAYGDPEIQKLGKTFTKHEMEVAAILLSMSRPLPASAEEQYQEHIAWPPIWSNSAVAQAVVGIGLRGKAKKINMPKFLGKTKVEKKSKPPKSTLKKR